jgi:hypothetical protein
MEQIKQAVLFWKKEPKNFCVLAVGASENRSFLGRTNLPRKSTGFPVLFCRKEPLALHHPIALSTLEQ